MYDGSSSPDSGGGGEGKKKLGEEKISTRLFWPCRSRGRLMSWVAEKASETSFCGKR